MVGVLKALGTNNWEIQKIFLYYASLISLAGISIGLISGVGLCLLEQKTHFIHMDGTPEVPPSRSPSYDPRREHAGR